MKKLCFITTVPFTMQAFVLDSAINLKRNKGFDVTLICNDDNEFGKSLPNDINYIPVNMERGINLKGFSAIKKLRRIFKDKNFDYIQYCTPNAALYSSIAGKISNMPVRLYAQWGIRYVGTYGLERRVLKLFEKLTCRLSTHIRMVSPMNMQFAIDEGLYKANKVKVIGNGGTIGVSLNEFDINKKEELSEKVFKEYGIDDNAFVFGFIGRMNRDKGLDELFGAFKILCEKGYNVKLFIVGHNEAVGVNESLLEWAHDCSDVIFTGGMPKSELARFYSAFDCYVHPTYREGFGMVLQEAGAMGNAIITTDIPGAGEVMEKDISCKLVPARNTGALADMMEYMINNPEAAKELGRQAYIRAKTLYERSIMLENIAKDIEEVIRGE